MKRASVVLFAALLCACASTPQQQAIHGRYALALQSNNGAYFTEATLPSWASAVVGDLRQRGAQVDVTADAVDDSSYDGVIVLSASTGGARNDGGDAGSKSPFITGTTESDASGDRVQTTHPGKLFYDVRRGRATVASGSANLTMATPMGGTPNKQLPLDVAAAHTLAADIARKLAGPAKIPGRFALVVDEPSLARSFASMTKDDIAYLENELQSSLRDRFTSADVVLDSSAASNYDTVIVLTTPFRSGTPGESSRSDVSGDAASQQHVGRLNYEVVRGGSRIAQGTVSMRVPVGNPYQSDRQSISDAARTLAADVAGKLGGR